MPEATKAWLAGSAPHELLPDGKGRTALRAAVDSQRSTVAHELIASLNPQLQLPRTALLTRDLVAIYRSNVT